MRRRRLALATGLLLAGCGPLHAPHQDSAALDDRDGAVTRVFLEVADVREDHDDLDGALAATERALVLQPHSRTAQLRRAELLLAIDARDGVGERLPEAREILARTLLPGDPSSLAAEARLEQAQGRPDAALAALVRATEAQPEAARPQRLLAVARLAAGDGAGALAAADRAVALDPGSLAARRERARVRLALGDASGAAEDARHVARQAPRDDAVRVVLARALLALGRADEARAALASIPPARRSAEASDLLGAIGAAPGDAQAAAPPAPENL